MDVEVTFVFAERFDREEIARGARRVLYELGIFGFEVAVAEYREIDFRGGFAGGKNGVDLSRDFACRALDVVPLRIDREGRDHVKAARASPLLNLAVDRAPRHRQADAELGRPRGRRRTEIGVEALAVDQRLAPRVVNRQPVRSEE